MSTSNVKKVFEPLVELLESNKNAKVKDILEQVYQLALSNKQASTSKVDANGKVTHIYCYYHKKWEDVTVCDYGAKASSTTGLNTMCKEGLSHWNKQNRNYKQGKEKILDQVMKGTLSPDQIEDEMLLLEQERDKIIPREDGHGTDE